MINPVNTFPVSYNTAIPNNVSQMQSQTIQQPPVQNPNMSGLDALAAYNQPTQKCLLQSILNLRCLQFYSLKL